MASKNTLYLLGAGASRLAIPILESFSQEMFKVLKNLSDSSVLEYYQGYDPITRNYIYNQDDDELKQLQKHIERDVDWFEFESRKHKSIDTLAKRFFLTNDHNNLRRLKALMSLYLIWLQIPHNYDQRYDSYFATMLRKENDKLVLPSNIAFISWNYDLQFEIGLVNYLKKSTLSELHELYCIWPNTFSSLSLHDEPILIKLNGTAGLYINPGSNEEKYDYKASAIENNLLLAKSETSNIIKILKEYFHLRDNQSIYSLINFAWENTAVTNYSFEKAKNLISKADKIIIIGYSFPIFNKEKDNALFEGLKSHKNPRKVKIFIQDPNAEKIKHKLISNFEIINNLATSNTTSDGLMKIFTETSGDQFLTPDDLMR